MILSVEIIQECLADRLQAVRMEGKGPCGFRNVRIYFPGNREPEEDTLYLCSPGRLSDISGEQLSRICLVTTECPEAEELANSAPKRDEPGGDHRSAAGSV